MGSHRAFKALQRVVAVAALLCTSVSAFADERVYLKVRETDGSPTVNTVTGIVVSNGTLTDNLDGTVAINTSGSAGAPTNATYITQTADGTLSNEQALASLSTGIMRVATTTGVVTSLTDSAGIATNISDETGSGALVFATSPTLVTPTLGVATATTLDTGQGANELYAMDQNVRTSDSPSFTAITEGANAVPNATDHLGFFANTTSAQLAGVITNETGSGVLMFATAPTFTLRDTASAAPTTAGDFGFDRTANVFEIGDGATTQYAAKGNATGESTAAANDSVALTTDTTGNYAAGDGEAGNALTGDTATAFFSAGQIEAARGGTGDDTSGSTGVPRISAGNWTYDAGISHLAASTSADLAGVLSNETGSGVAVFGTSPTITTPIFGTSADFGSAGVRITDDGDGAITLLGLGNGNDEDLKLNLDDGVDGANTAEFTSSTGLTQITFTSIDLKVPTEAYDATGWNGDLTVPTKDAVRDKIEAMASGWTDNGTTLSTTTDGDSVIIGGATAVGSSGTSVLMIETGTAPTTSPTGAIQIYAANGTDATVLMLHGDGADGSTTMTDSSASPKTVTANGNAQIDTAQSKFGGASILFDGTTDYLTSADNAAWDFDTGDFTIQMWIRWSTVGNQVFLDRNNALEYSFFYTGTQLQWTAGNSNIKDEVWSPSANTWYFVELSRSGTSLRMFVDGTELGSATSNSTNVTGSSTLYIGTYTNTTAGFNGWMDDLRILKGKADHTSNYSVPTSALSNSSATAEANVRDETGNVTTFSPHNIDGIPTETINAIVAANHIPVTVHHKNVYAGIEEWIDLTTLALEVQKLSGKKIIHSKLIEPESWDENAEKNFVWREVVKALKASDPTFNPSKLTDAEIERRAEWLAVKVAKEAELQAKVEANGGKLPEEMQPPTWMRPLVEKAKDRLKDGE